VRAPWLAAWLAFVVLALAASPAHFWLDSGELGAAGYDLGVAHPPGAPGLLLLLRVATLLPLGSLGFRMALVSCALGAAAVGLVVAVLQRRGADPLLATLAGAWVLASLTFVRQGRVVEVYALGVALFMVVLWGLDPAVAPARQTSRRLLAVAAATWAAWCFGDLRLAFGPLILVAWVVAWRARAPWARWAPLVATHASLVIVALPLGSVGAPELDWGDPDTWPAMIDQLMARSIREAFADEILPASWPLWALHGAGALDRLAEDLGAPGLVVAVVCVVLVFRRDPAEPAASPRSAAVGVVWLAAAELFYAVGINPMGGADRQTGLVLAPLAALAVGETCRRWLRGRGRLRWGVLPLLATVLLLPPLLHSGPDAAVTRSWAPHAWTRAALAQLPPGALLLTQSDDLAAGLAAARLLEGARPDVVTAPAQHLYRPTPEAAAVDPRRAAIWDAAHTAHDEAGRIQAALAAHAGPVALESPGTGLFAAVPWWSEHGRLPLGVAGAGAAVGVAPKVEVEAWRSRLPTAEDRRRLAVALAHWARARVQRGGSIAEAGAALELSLTEVDERHASALVTLAALRDRVGDSAGAIALTRRALELEPGRHAALTNLALYLARDPATVAEALDVAERAVALRPWKADGWARLAQVRAAAGDAQGASEARAHAAAVSVP
jgi:tetratricopeptide (TPR) repeat protein